MNEALFFISKSCQGGGIERPSLKQLFLKIPLLILFLSISSLTDAQISIGDFNIAHAYDPQAEISLAHNLEMTPDSLTFHAQLTKHQDKSFIDDYTFSFYLVNSYGEKLDNPVATNEIDSIYLGKKDDDYFLTFRIPRRPGQNLLVVKVLSKFTGYQHYYDIPLATRVPITIHTDTGAPIITSWLNPGRFKIHNENSVFGFYYRHEFPAALPPMVTKDGPVSKNIEVDSTFRVENEETFVIKNTGLYLLQTDTTSSSALSFRLEDRYFPKSAKLDQLVDPLIYITTKEEKRALENAKDSKAKFDQFWLDLTRSSERAKDIIKNYYDRVEEANRLFTSYKPGWKTDRGMIYIIFGPPSQVFKTNNEEAWVYLSTKELRKIEFQFVKANSIFSNSHYALVRDKKYADSWFKAISRIRQGRF